MRGKGVNGEKGGREWRGVVPETEVYIL